MSAIESAKIKQTNCLSNFLTIDKKNQKEQILNADSDAVVELFASALDSDKSNIPTSLKLYALQRIHELKDQLNSTQINTIQTLCQDNLLQITTEDQQELTDEVVRFFYTTATVDQNNVVELIGFAHKNKSTFLLQKCFDFIKTQTNTTLTCLHFGPISIRIKKHNNDTDVNLLKNYIPTLVTAVGKNNVQIKLTLGTILTIETLKNFVLEARECMHTFVIELKRNDVTDNVIADLLKNCTKLRHLGIFSSIINGEGLREINQLTSLQTLDLSFCYRLTSLPELAALTNLQTLNLHDCYCLNFLPELAKLTGLQMLNLSGCESLKSLPELAALINLQILNLSCCRSLKSLPALVTLTSLQMLILYNCQLLSFLPELAGLTNLHTINLSSCSSLASLPILATLINLQILNLYGCTALTSLSDLAGLIKLQTLTLAGCSNLKSLDDLGTLTSLQTLDLYECNNLQPPSAFNNIDRRLKKITSISLPFLFKLSSRKEFLFAMWKFHLMANSKRFFDNGFSNIQKDSIIQYWRSEFVSDTGASSSSSSSEKVSDQLEKKFQTYDELKSKDPANPHPVLDWMRFVLLRLATLDEVARQWVLDKAILDVIFDLRNPTARYPIAEVVFRVAEDSALRGKLNIKEIGFIKTISGRHNDLKALLPYLTVALEGRGVVVSSLKDLLGKLGKKLLGDRTKFVSVLKLFTNLYFLDELDEIQMNTLLKAVDVQSLSNDQFNGKTFLKRCHDISTLISFEAFDKLKQENLQIDKAVEEAFTEAVPVNVEKLVKKFNKTYSNWRNPFVIMAYASNIKSLENKDLNVHLCNLVTATLENKFSEFRYDLERVPDLKAIDLIDPEFLNIWKDASNFPTEEWSPSDSTQKVEFISKTWLFEKLVKFKHIENPEATEYILRFLNGDDGLKEKIAQELTEKIRLDENNQTLSIQDLCIQLYRAENDVEKRGLLKSLSAEMRGKEGYVNFLNDISAVLTNKGENKGKYVIYATDHPSDLLNIGEMGGSCQNVFTASAQTNQGVLGSSSTGTFQLIVMKSAYGPMEKSVSRILIHAHPHGDEIAVYAERLYDDTRQKGVEKALMDYAKSYVELLGPKCVLVNSNPHGTPYGRLESKHSGPPVYIDSAGGIQNGPYSIPNSYRYS